MQYMGTTKPNHAELVENLRIELRSGCLVLAVLAELRAEHYGYTLRKKLAELGLEIEENTLYPMLRRLEAQGLLAADGEPFVVAQRYGGAQRGFAFGWQLISPQAFPAYVIALSLVIGMALLSNVALLLFGSESLLTQPRRLVTTLAALFVVVTV